MKAKDLTIPELVLLAGTRVTLGVGLGLLIADRMGRDTRRGAGWGLFTFGALSALPIVVGILSKTD